MKANTIFRNTTDGDCYRVTTPFTDYSDGWCKPISSSTFRSKMGHAYYVPLKRDEIKNALKMGIIEILPPVQRWTTKMKRLEAERIAPIPLKPKRTLTIEYKIVSQKCLKSIVSGVRSFGDDNSALRFVKRLVSVKNALCKRSDGEQWSEINSEQKRMNNRAKKYGITDAPIPFNENGLPYILSYNCKTV